MSATYRAFSRGACGKHLAQVAKAAIDQGVRHNGVLVTQGVFTLTHPYCHIRGCGNPAIYTVSGSLIDRSEEVLKP